MLNIFLIFFVTEKILKFFSSRKKVLEKNLEKKLGYIIDVKFRARSIGAIFRAIAALLPS